VYFNTLEIKKLVHSKWNAGSANAEDRNLKRENGRSLILQLLEAQDELWTESHFNPRESNAFLMAPLAVKGKND
jgi:hypothetical protein